MSENPINIIGEIKGVIEKLNTKQLESWGISKIHQNITYSDKEDIWSIEKPLIGFYHENGKEEYMVGLIFIDKDGEENYEEGSVVEIFRRIKKNNEFDYYVRPHLFSNPEVTTKDLSKLKEVFFWQTKRTGKKATVKVEERNFVLSHSPSPS